MWDTSIPMIGLCMRLNSLENLPVFELPSGYAARFYRPGDVPAWARIEASAQEFASQRRATEVFYQCFPTGEGLDERLIFLAENDEPFATVTAWYGEDGPGGAVGRLRWVGIDQAHQGRGLSKPLISMALHRMRALGHSSVFLTTQTASWVAIRMYYTLFGFRPEIREPAELEGWKVISEVTGIDFLKGI